MSVVPAAPREQVDDHVPQSIAWWWTEPNIGVPASENPVTASSP
ncbi:hypothetical protein EV191_101279 [Tamaricihabitans halophyticus]|uniref:Uncharacterized protein n=1 Tax=Tamaricihabitans halophyticus TaxID=1262583 RepID=A0A4R2R3W3_9PSEU|nr:hypothetical protein EV191_101279 [Tamaricihabitans halophyticus]